MNILVTLLVSCTDSVSEIFAALAHRRRRYVLYTLQEADTTLSTEELADEIVARERDQPGSEFLTDHTQDIHTDLVHNHLPKLQTTGLIEYDHQIGKVTYRDPPRMLETCLDLAADYELAE